MSRGRSGRGLALWVDDHLRLPAGVPCELRNLVGKVGLDNVASGCRVDCASADVKAGGQQGDLLGDSGNVFVEDMVGRLSLDSGSGNLHIRRLGGDLTADTGSGDVILIGS